MTAHGRAIACIAASTLLSSIAQLVFRFVMQSHNLVSAGVENGWIDLLETVTQADLLLLATGVFLYGISMLAWIVVLSKFDLSFAYPIMSISYVLVFLFAVSLPMFDEAVSAGKAAAVALIVGGVLLLSGDPENAGNGGTGG